MTVGTVKDRAHRRRRFSGRDPEEHHRASTPLELLYDLTIVVAFGTAADQLADHIADGHVVAGVGGFVFAVFAVSWAWLQYSWFASAYDTDDWVFRLATMVQMIGVIILALGLAPMFASLQAGHTLDDRVMVAGYVVMRVGLLCLWWLVSRQDPVRAPAARSYITTIGVTQIGWIALAAVGPSVGVTLAGFAVLLPAELAGPWISERKVHTPWHPHHIAERYSLLVIITLGEVILGTVESVNAVVHGEAGWSADAALVAVAGVGIAFGCWWMYLAVPGAETLVRHRERAFTFGYGHLVIFGALAAIGAGLHVAALELEGKAEVGALGAILTVAVALAVYCAMFYCLYSVLMRARDPFHLALVLITVGLLALAIVLAAIGVNMALCLVVLALVPAVTVVGYETLGHRHVSAALKRL